MVKKLPDPLPELVLSSSDSGISQAISRAVKVGKLEKIAPRIYTSNTADPSEEIIRRNFYWILGKLYPGALISHRSALEGRPTDDWTIFLTYKYTKKIELPGATVRLLEGPPLTKEDMPFLDGLFMSATPRAYLESMQPSRSRGSASKTLPKQDIEARLDRIIRIHGEPKLNALRDKARRTAAELGMEGEFEALNKMIGALLTTQPAQELVSPLARARADRRPFDPDRLELFQELFTALKGVELHTREETDFLPESSRNMALFDAYCSNCIEGTVFELEEARAIVWEGEIPAERPADAHDILATYRLVVDTREMSRVPESEESLIALLQSRHGTILESRPDTNPGTFKEKPNRAGQTHFVAPELVRGTLGKGYEFYRALEHPLAKAMFIMFIVAEVHPFVDGNGRIARIMMNAELISVGLRRILIPTVYREDYLLALRALSRNRTAEPYTKMVDRAQRFSAKVDFSSYDGARDILERANAFQEPADARFLDDL